MTESFRKGPLTMLFSSLCFAVMAFFAKLTGGRVPGAEISFFRFAVGIGAALILAASGRISLRAGRKDLLIARGVFGGGSILLLFLALSRGSLTNITVLNNTYPIFATLAAALFLREGIGWATGASMAVTWAGVWLLVHPDFQHLRWPELMSLASAILAGGAVVAVRELRRRGEPSWTVYFYLSLFGLGFSFLAALPFWVWPDRREGIVLAAHGPLWFDRPDRHDLGLQVLPHLDRRRSLHDHVRLCRPSGVDCPARDHDRRRGGRRLPDPGRERAGVDDDGQGRADGGGGSAGGLAAHALVSFLLVTLSGEIRRRSSPGYTPFRRCEEDALYLPEGARVVRRGLLGTMAIAPFGDL